MHLLGSQFLTVVHIRHSLLWVSVYHFAVLLAYLTDSIAAGRVGHCVCSLNAMICRIFIFVGHTPRT